MSEVPAGLRYAKSHEWLKPEGDGTATIGISAYAQDSLGDITFVQLPKAGAKFKAGEPFGVVESVKAASDLYAPAAGVVVAANAALASNPELVNKAPYGEGWIVRMKLDNPGDAGALLDAAGYESLTKG
jgi:glycine cleavage system H protein